MASSLVNNSSFQIQRSVIHLVSLVPWWFKYPRLSVLSAVDLPDETAQSCCGPDGAHFVKYSSGSCRLSVFSFQLRKAAKGREWNDGISEIPLRKAGR